MVSRIESDGGNLNWHTERLLNPNSSVTFLDENPTKKTLIYTVLCRPDNSRTEVYEVEDNEFIERRKWSDPKYTCLALLEAGDPYFIVNVFTANLGSEIKLRISHE